MISKRLFISLSFVFLSYAQPVFAQSQGLPNINPAWIGIVANDKISTRFKSEGIFVKKVLIHSPASIAGLNPKDIVVSVNGHPTPNIKAYKAATRHLKAGDIVKFKILRQRKPLNIKMRIGKRPSKLEMLKHQWMGKSLGNIKFQTLSPNPAVKTLKNLSSRPVLIVFWGTWCKSCHRHFKKLAAFQKDNPNAVHIVALSTESEKHLSAYQKNLPDSLIIARDINEEAHQLFKVDRYPFMVLIDRQYKVRKFFTGLHHTNIMIKAIKNL